jgi:mitochondrial import inner membrane translocase subunit TIM50
MWASTVLFFYHFYMLKQGEASANKMKLAPFWELAKKVDWHMYELQLLLTRPPVSKLLPDRTPSPPGTMYPKTLVLNLRGTLIHSEYKFGVGFEVQKRPGLSTFINRLGRQYELVIFGDEESGIIMDICMALDPKSIYIPGRFGREATSLHDG